jgi:hypothetical protein
VAEEVQIKMITRCYKELKRLTTFNDRYRYLKLSGVVGETTFGFDRYLNQLLYTSRRWKKIRDDIIIRDSACDLGMDGFEINDVILVHHINPITVEDIELERNIVYDPEFLICTSKLTHNAIHFGDESLLPKLPVQRRPNDTCPWR